MNIKGKLQFYSVIWFLLFSTTSFSFSNQYHDHTHNTSYSNIIVFGDSQSDIGNGPESLIYYDSTTTPTKVSATLYVPISNPVNIKTDQTLPNIDIDFPPLHSRSKHFKLTLPNPQPICINGVCHRKKYHAFNWVEYFIYNGIKRGLIGTPADLRPWVIQYKQKSQASINQSVDYAWYSAMTDSKCHNFFHYSITACTINQSSLNASIYQRQRQYRNNQSKKDDKKNIHLRHQMIIPSVQKQIEMFKSDLRSHKVTVGPNTLYIVWTAANDIAWTFEQYGKKMISTDTVKYQLQSNLPNMIAGSSKNSIINQLIKLGAKHIIILGQYNLGLTPEALSNHHIGFVKHAVIQKADKFIALYNQSLQNLIAKNFNTRAVQYIDVQGSINQLVFDHGQASAYLQTLGETCDTIASQEALQQGDAVSCYDRNSVPLPIGWWNRAHLSTQLNQLIAATMLDSLSFSK